MNRWTQQEIEELERLRDAYTLPEVSRRLGRSVSAIKQYINKNKLAKRDLWSKKEDRLLIKNYCIITAEEIGLRVGRTAAAVHQRAKLLGLTAERTHYKKWSSDDDSYLIANYQRLSSIEMSKILGTTPHAVRARASSLGIKKNRK